MLFRSLESSLASAQPSTAEAEQLFRDGKRLLAEGNIAAGCDAFAASQRREPTLSTLLNLADCREKNQQYASAWGHFIDAARQARTDSTAAAQRSVAENRANALEGRLSFLIVSVPDEARVPGLIITRDGASLEADLWNRDIPVDGGKYVIAGKAPGFEAWSTTVTVASARDKQSVNVPRFRAVPTLPNEGLKAEPAPARHKTTASVALWATGGVVLVAGVGAELWAQSTYADAKADMNNDRRHDLTSSATTRRRLGVSLDVAAIIVAGIGTYLWFSPTRERGLTVVPAVTRDSSHVTVAGWF